MILQHRLWRWLFYKDSKKKKRLKRIQNGVGEQMKEKNLCSIACMNESIQYKQSIFFLNVFSTVVIYPTHISMGYNNPLSFACKLNKCLLHKKEKQTLLQTTFRYKSINVSYLRLARFKNNTMCIHLIFYSYILC